MYRDRVQELIREIQWEAEERAQYHWKRYVEKEKECAELQAALLRVCAERDEYKAKVVAMEKENT